MGKIFEKMCHEYLSMLSSRKTPGLPFKILRIGRWWGANPITKSEEEIDIIGINDRLSSIVFCECKYRNELINIQILDTLVNKTKR